MKAIKVFLFCIVAWTALSVVAFEIQKLYNYFMHPAIVWFMEVIFMVIVARFSVLLFDELDKKKQ